MDLKIASRILANDLLQHHYYKQLRLDKKDHFNYFLQCSPCVNTILELIDAHNGTDGELQASSSLSKYPHYRMDRQGKKNNGTLPRSYFDFLPRQIRFDFRFPSFGNEHYRVKCFSQRFR